MRARVADLKKYVEEFSPRRFRRLYFVPHTPDADLIGYKAEKGENVKVILPEHLAKMVVDLGLTDWVLKKIK